MSDHPCFDCYYDGFCKCYKDPYWLADKAKGKVSMIMLHTNSDNYWYLYFITLEAGGI
ncbi:MAG: hypothetical protein HUJ51_05045 [Eggerthellaceae bacterium]|nr:hypothetical protein [Eggerthellaceae bacterium]